MIRYSDEDIKYISCNLLSEYNTVALDQWLAKLEWANERGLSVLLRRKQLSEQLVASLGQNDPGKFTSAVDAVYQWGFNDRPLKSDPHLLADLKQCLVEALISSEVPDEGLATVLGHAGIGLATATKWLAMLGPNFAIFDSRVSASLRNVCSPIGRAFPIVGRRPVIGRQDWPQSALLTNPQRAARAYGDYVRVLRQTSKSLLLASAKWPPANIEAALFMAGKDVTANGRLSSLPRNMWAA